MAAGGGVIVKGDPENNRSEIKTFCDYEITAFCGYYVLRLGHTGPYADSCSLPSTFKRSDRGATALYLWLADPNETMAGAKQRKNAADRSLLDAEFMELIARLMAEGRGRLTQDALQQLRDRLEQDANRMAAEGARPNSEQADLQGPGAQTTFSSEQETSRTSKNEKPLVVADLPDLTISELIRLFDKDGDGKLNAKEMQEVIKLVLKASSRN